MLHWLKKHYWGSYLLSLLVLGWGHLLWQGLRETGSVFTGVLVAAFATVLAVSAALARREKPLLKQQVWQGLFRVFMGCTALLLAVLGFWLLTGTGPGLLGHLQLIAALVLLLPAEQQLHRYAYRQPAIWQRHQLRC